MKREIVIWPDPRLLTVSQPVKEVDDAVRQLLDDMVETMHAARGAGLAAPQVGFNLRLVVVMVKKLGPPAEEQAVQIQHEVLKLVNPRIVEHGIETMPVLEGCLSVPGAQVDTRRYVRVKVDALDENGKPIEIEGDGNLAVALQHEIEHLDGKMHLDQLSPLKRSVLARKFTKAKKRGMRYLPAPAQ